MTQWFNLFKVGSIYNYLVKLQFFKVLIFVYVVMFMQSHYRWSPEFDSQVKQRFKERVQVRLKDQHYQIISRKDGKRPKWMSENMHKWMLKNAEEEEFRRRSEHASKNRRGGDLSNPVQPSHCQGSMSAVQRAKRLVSVVLLLFVLSTFVI